MNTQAQPFATTLIGLGAVNEAVVADTRLNSLKEIATRQGTVRHSDGSLLALHVTCEGRIMATNIETHQHLDVFSLYKQGDFQFETITHTTYYEMLHIAELRGYINWLDTDVIEQVWFDSLCNVRISAAHKPSRVLPVNQEGVGYRCEPVGVHAVLMGQLWDKTH